MKRMAVLLILILFCLPFFGCAAYGREAYKVVPRRDELKLKYAQELQFSYEGKDERPSGVDVAKFMAGPMGEIFVNGFSFKAQGFLASMVDNVTGVSMMINSRGMIIYYDGKFFVNGKETDLVGKGKAIEFASTANASGEVFISLNYLKSLLGFDVKFNVDNDFGEIVLMFAIDAKEVRKNSGGIVANVSNIRNVAPLEVIISGVSNTIYTAAVDDSASERARYDVVSRFVTQLTDEGFEVLVRPDGLNALMVRNEAYVCVRSWTSRDVKVDYINCVPR